MLIAMNYSEGIYTIWGHLFYITKKDIEKDNNLFSIVPFLYKILICKIAIVYPVEKNIENIWLCMVMEDKDSYPTYS